MTINLGHIIVDFDPSSKDGKWKDFNELAEKEGFKFNLEHRVQKVENKGKSVVLTALNKKGKK